MGKTELTLGDAAKHARLHPHDVTDAIRKGHLPAKRPGGRWRIARIDLERWLANRFAEKPR